MCIEKIERLENAREGLSTQRIPGVDDQSQEGTIGEHHPSQEDQGSGQVFKNENVYTELINRTSSVRQQDTYNQLSIYRSEHALAAYYVNEKDIELEQQSKDYENIDSDDYVQYNQRRY